MKKSFPFFYFICALTLAGCNSTRIESSWREPNKEISIARLNKVLIVALLDNDKSNRKAEDQMAGYLNGKGVVSYNYLGEHVTMNEDNIRQKIKTDGFDGAVTMRLTDINKETVYQPGIIASYPQPYVTFSQYYLNSWAYYISPGHYATTKIYSVETNIFSIKEDKIIWTGVTKTTNPNGLRQMTEDISKVLFNKMIAEGFVTKK